VEHDCSAKVVVGDIYAVAKRATRLQELYPKLGFRRRCCPSRSSDSDDERLDVAATQVAEATRLVVVGIT
jgi:predicted ATP-dependent serine protease